ncbi:DUF4932 domain-containing protein [Mycoplasmatota bacterium WC44]
MRKHILILFAITLLSSCSDTKSVAIVEEANLQSISVTMEDSLKIAVDPRIEILTIIQYLGGYQPLTKLDSQYKHDIDEYFDEFRGHEAVTKFMERSKAGFSYDAPISLFLSSSHLPNIEVSDNTLESSINRAGGLTTVMKFYETVNDFYEVTNFKSFFDNHREFYTQMIINYQSEIIEAGLIKTLESYYGMSQNSYTIVLSPMLHGGGYGPRIKVEDNKYDVYSIIGPTNIVDSKLEYNFASYIILHEFGHSFVNPLTEINGRSIVKYTNLFSEIKEEMSKMAYGNWTTTVNEHIVRAIVCRMNLEMYGEEQYNINVDREVNKGFIYIEHILKKLEYYENNRDEYKNLEEFFPELIQAFENY